MLWSNPTILYNTIVDYRIENNRSWPHYWKLKYDPTISVIRFKNKVCLLTIPSNVNQISILWQHLFLNNRIKELHTGWHICLLPRHMVVAIKDGLYICERLAPKKEELVESTKSYLYRFGYEPESSLLIHDWRQDSEDVKIPTDYDAFILQPHQSWHKRIKSIVSLFSIFFSPHITNILLGTLFSLSAGSLYYVYQNYTHDFAKIQILRSWPSIENRKIRIKKLLELVGLLNEAKTPQWFIQNISIDDCIILIKCSEAFPPDKNLETIKCFLKKYYPHSFKTNPAGNKNITICLS